MDSFKQVGVIRGNMWNYISISKRNKAEKVNVNLQGLTSVFPAQGHHSRGPALVYLNGEREFRELL